MDPQVGDRIVQSEKVGLPDREGEVLDMFTCAYGTCYRVLWDDGRESMIRPNTGTVRTIPKPAGTSTSTLTAGGSDRDRGEGGRAE
jgi:hypothetical protein